MRYEKQFYEWWEKYVTTKTYLNDDEYEAALEAWNEAARIAEIEWSNFNGSNEY